MKADEIDEVLRQTLDDDRLSRSEKKALTAIFAEHAEAQRLDFFRHRAFAIARERLNSGEAKKVIDWLEEVAKALVAATDPSVAPKLAEAHFSPGDNCLRRIVSLINRCKQTAEVCVFTITDDRIANALVEAHHRRVRVRVISDNDKAFDRGSDIEALERAGIAVRVDQSEHHMHHKFAIFDQSILVTGSYNWTRSAAMHNEENIIVSTDTRLLDDFTKAFEKLWQSFKP